VGYKKNILKIVLVLLLSGALYAFASARNAERPIQTLKVYFTGDNNLFLTQSSVSKLLIQNQGPLTDKAKRIIDLNELEVALKSNRIIKEAEVFMSVTGELIAEIEQKRPIARMLSENIYVDETGTWMPLSKNYSARVPLVTGQIDTSDLRPVYRIARWVDQNAFLKEHITEIHQTSGAEFNLRLRGNDIVVELGDTTELGTKFNNLKAFYQKAIKDDIIEQYTKLNLRFTSQVICTKK
jgi:cell division protein FtsQ